MCHNMEIAPVRPLSRRSSSTLLLRAGYLAKILAICNVKFQSYFGTDSSTYYIPKYKHIPSSCHDARASDGKANQSYIGIGIKMSYYKDDAGFV